jgi:hypothetical protein
MIEERILMELPADADDHASRTAADMDASAGTAPQFRVARDLLIGASGGKADEGATLCGAPRGACIKASSLVADTIARLAAVGQF